MSTSEAREAKADAAARMVQDAKLQTTFLESRPEVIHTIRNRAAPGSLVWEHWEQKKNIGQGGFGSVNLEECIKAKVFWDDSDHENERDDGATKRIGWLRAVKQISKPQGQSSLSEEFMRELYGLVSFTEPKYEYHFVKTFGWYESNRKLYIAMEYMPLGDLQSNLVEKGPFEETDANIISKQVLRGLEFMHEKGFVHRDLKPANLLIRMMPSQGAWWIKISDFGLSKKIEQSWTSSSTECGTIGFMAPELFGFNTPGTPLSQLGKWKAVDIWAFGETVYRLLTGVSSFGHNIQDLGEYSRGEKSFPWKALKKNNVSADGIEFIRSCMAPSPTDRPSANAALEQLGWPMTHVKNEYKDWTAKTTSTIPCKGEQAPFILFTPEGEHLLVIEAQKISIWNIMSQKVINSHEIETNANFCHGSIHPDGKYLCVTRRNGRKHLILQDAINLENKFAIYDNLDGAGNGPSMSTFSPDGETLVTARNDLLCQIDIKNDWTATNQHCVAADPKANRDKTEDRIVQLRFTPDGSHLIAACHTHVVLMHTMTNRWFKERVADYPCLPSPSGLDISWNGKMLACGSTTGELWLQTSKIDCWVRLTMPPGGPGAISEPVENVRFSGTGRSILYNLRGHSTVKACRSSSLEQVSFTNTLSNHPGQRLGHSLRKGGVGATALGGDGGASVIFWEYQP